jgi:hypothetical protein
MLVSREGAIPVTLEVCAPWFEACELRLELDRFRRVELDRVEVLRVGDPSAPSMSLNVEVDDPVDATDAVCWRRRDNSLVNRFTCAKLTCMSFLWSILRGSRGPGVLKSYLPLPLVPAQVLDGDPKASAVEDDAMALVLLVGSLLSSDLLPL